MKHLLLALLLTGCARQGFRYPGPLRGMGTEPLPYADRIAQRQVEVESGSIDGTSSPARRRSRDGEAVARAASDLVGESRIVVEGTAVRYDCSGFVSAAHALAGLDVSGSSASLHALALRTGTFHERRAPEIGDVVFFDNTWDRNGNGRRDDSLTHVAIVESIDANGTQTLVHLGSRGIVRMMMNLEQPDVARDGSGSTLNSYLRRGSTGERLTGQLWSGYGSLWSIRASELLSLQSCVATPFEGQLTAEI